jgi:hypothetical protein
LLLGCLLCCRLVLRLKLHRCCLNHGRALLVSWLLFLLDPRSFNLLLGTRLLQLLLAQLTQLLVLLQQACLQQLLSQLPALAGAVKHSSLLPQRVGRLVSKDNAPPTS